MRRLLHLLGLAAAETRASACVLAGALSVLWSVLCAVSLTALLGCAPAPEEGALHDLVELCRSGGSSQLAEGVPDAKASLFGGMSWPAGSRIRYEVYLPARSRLVWRGLEWEEGVGTLRVDAKVPGRDLSDTGELREASGGLVLELGDRAARWVELSFTLTDGEGASGGGVSFEALSIEALEAGGGDVADRPNIILYVIDTLRADHLGSYGYERDTSPRIDEFAADAVLYERALAQSSWTRPSMVSILTGLYPSRHGVNQRNDSMPEELLTLAEMLQGAGYETAAIVTNANASEVFGFDQGYHVFRWLKEQTSRPRLHHYSDRVNEEALAWLQARTSSQPFFLYLHTSDPHSPYTPPQSTLADFAGDFDEGFGTEEYRARISSGEIPASRVAEQLIDLYDAEIAFNDQHFGALLDELKSRGLYDSSLILLTADHGEAFFEHGVWEHGKTLHREAVRVPLISKFPSSEGLAGERRTRLAQHVDILPTVLEVAGIPLPETIQGESLRSVARLPDGDVPPRVGFSLQDVDGRFSEAVVSGEWKLIRGRRPLERELYDLSGDVEEGTNLFSSERSRSRRMESLLDEHVRKAEPLRAPVAHPDKEVEAALRAMGYID